MTIRVKVLLISGVALLAISGLMYAISRFTFIRGIADIEENHTADTVGQTLNAYSYVVSRLETDTATWATSDDAYDFIAGDNEDYAASYLANETFSALDVSLIVFIDDEGAVVLGKAFDPIAGAEVPLPASLVDHLSENGPLFGPADARTFGSGIILLDEGPLLVASQPILTSRGEGPVRGAAIFGRYLDASLIADLERVVGFPVMMRTLDETPNAEFTEAVASLSAEQPILVRQRDSQLTVGYSLLHDVYGEPALVLTVDVPRETLKLGEIAVAYYILSVLGAGILVVAGAMVVLQKQVFSRFARLIRGIDAITVSGDTSQRLSIGGGDELASISGTVNAMLSTIEGTAIKMRESEEELRVHYELEKEMRIELEEETKKRTEFTRALVHELRTPITPVLAATELLLEGTLNDQSRRLVESIDRSATNLNRRIDELIDLIRGETDMLPLAMQPVDVLSLLRDIGNEMTPVAATSGHSLTVDLPAASGNIMGDSDRLRQIVQNLMNNAFKFTPSGGEITLLARIDNATLVVEVHDTGPGIDKEDLERLFDPYYRRVEDRERLSGLGLGLAISKRLVELHGGEIWVKSRAGEGTTLGFSLPLVQSDEDSDEVIP